MSTYDQLLAIGEAIGEARGEARGETYSARVIKLHLKGHSAAAIAKELHIEAERVARIIADFERE